MHCLCVSVSPSGGWEASLGWEGIPVVLSQPLPTSLWPTDSRGEKRKGIKMTARLKIGSAPVTVVEKASPLQSKSSPPSLSPGVCREWRHPRSRPALRPEWGTGALSLRGFFPGSSYDLSPSATLCAWIHRDRAVWLHCQFEIDPELRLYDAFPLTFLACHSVLIFFSVY